MTGRAQVPCWCTPQPWSRCTLPVKQAGPRLQIEFLGATTGHAPKVDDKPFGRDPQAKSDFRLRPDAPLLARSGFRPIPVDEIGLYPDPYRASWPVKRVVEAQQAVDALAQLMD